MRVQYQPATTNYNPLVNNSYFFNNTKNGTVTSAPPYNGGEDSAELSAGGKRELVELQCFLHLLRLLSGHRARQYRSDGILHNRRCLLGRHHTDSDRLVVRHSSRFSLPESPPRTPGRDITHLYTRTRYERAAAVRQWRHLRI